MTENEAWDRYVFPSTPPERRPDITMVERRIKFKAAAAAAKFRKEHPELAERAREEMSKANKTKHRR